MWRSVDQRESGSNVWGAVCEVTHAGVGQWTSSTAPGWSGGAIADLSPSPARLVVLCS